MKKKITLEAVHNLIVTQGKQLNNKIEGVNTKIDNVNIGLGTRIDSLAASTAREFLAVHMKMATLVTKDELEQTKEELSSQINGINNRLDYMADNMGRVKTKLQMK